MFLEKGDNYIMLESKIKTNYAIMSLWLARELESKGFKCIETGPNYYKPGFQVFYFEDTNDLRATVNELKKRKKLC